MSATASVDHMFRPMAAPAVPGELRCKTWQMAIRIGDEERSELWRKRCHDYWERQMKLYGYVVGDFTIAVETIDGHHFLSTYAPVLAVLPGERMASLKAAN